MKEALISVIIIAGWLAKYMKETRLSAFLYMRHCSAMSNLKIRFRDCSTDSDHEADTTDSDHRCRSQILINFAICALFSFTSSSNRFFSCCKANTNG